MEHCHPERGICFAKRSKFAVEGSLPIGTVPIPARHPHTSLKAKKRATLPYFLLAFPSITSDHFVPSSDISNINVYEVADVIFMVKRPFIVIPPIFSSLVHVTYRRPAFPANRQTRQSC